MNIVPEFVKWFYSLQENNKQRYISQEKAEG